MAAQKKSASTKGGKTSSAKKNGGKGKSLSAQALRKKKAEESRKRRVYAAVVCLVAALFGILGYFSTDAILLNWFRTLCCGLIGVGYWFTPPALLVIAYFLLNRKTPFISRVICTAIVPAMLGALYQVLCPKPELNDSFFESLKLMWTDGIHLEGGGAVSGMTAVMLSNLISRPATFIILLLILIILILKICNSSLVEFVSQLQDRLDERAARREEERALLESEPPEEEQMEDYSVRIRKKEKSTRQKKTGTESAPVHSPGPSIDVPMVDYDETEEPEPSESGIPDMIPEPLSEEPAAEEVPMPSPAEADVIDPDLDLNLDEFPESPDFVLEEDPLLPAGKNDLPTSETRPAVQKPDERQDSPQEKMNISREPAVPRVTKKDAAAAMTAVTMEAAAAMEQPVEKYQFPPLDLLDAPKAASTAGVKEEMASTQAILVDTIESFGIAVHLKDVTRGPAVARFELELDRGVKLSKLTNLADDIALSLGVSGVRIAPVPDKPSMVGIEVPNRRVNPVPIRSVIDSDAFRRSKSSVSFALGKDIGGTCVISDISRLPHLLIAGTTGSGKSVCINSLLISLLYKAGPEEVRLIMVDPKQVELGVYNGIPHLLIPVVTEAKKAAGALQWAVTEMTRRYAEIAEVGARRLSEYNKIAERDPDRDTMPSIVIVIDELADLMMVAGKEVEESICRIAQLGRAAGMHLVVATQRPSSDVITGLMKANIPSRISFAVASAVESRIILDASGAEKLVGRGDMLYHPIGANKSLRVQGCLISDEEVARVVEFVKQNSGEVVYDDNISRQVNIAAAETAAKSGKGKKEDGDAFGAPLGDYDELLPDAVDIVLELGQASVSMLQRRLKLGYARAARLVDQMEELGYVGPFEGSKPRQLKITKEEWAQKRAELYGVNPEQMAFDMNEDALQADLLDPDDDI